MLLQGGNSKNYSFNINPLLLIERGSASSKLYSTLNFSALTTSEPEDLNGYLGEVRRPKEELTPASDEEVLRTLSLSEKDFARVMHTIKTIDRDQNGFVTVTELDDILKIVYPPLKGRDLTLFMEPFRSIQNRILVNYR